MKNNSKVKDKKQFRKALTETVGDRIIQNMRGVRNGGVTALIGTENEIPVDADVILTREKDDDDKKTG